MDNEITTAVIWAVQNPGAVLPLFGLLLLIALVSLGMLLLDPDI